MKTAVVRARVEPALKKKAEKVLATMGMDLSESIRLYLREVTNQRAIPFLVRAPNAASRRALKEARTGKGKTYRSASEMFKGLRSR